MSDRSSGLAQISRDKQEARRSQLRATSAPDASRRRREASNLEIRKARKGELLLNRRRAKLGASALAELAGGAGPPVMQLDGPTMPVGRLASVGGVNLTRIEALKAAKQRGDEIRSGLASDDIDTVYRTVGLLRRIMTVVRPPVEAVLAMNVHQRVVMLMVQSAHTGVRFECGWIVCNIVGESAQATGMLVQHFNLIALALEAVATATDPEHLEQQVWLLGNIAGAHDVFRDRLLSEGALGRVLGLIGERSPPTMVRTAVFATRAFLGGTSRVPVDVSVASLPKLLLVLRMFGPAESSSSPDGVCGAPTKVVMMLRDCVQTVACIADVSEVPIQLLIESGIVPYIVDFASHSDDVISYHCVRVLGSMCGGIERHTQAAIDFGVVPLFRKMLLCTRERVKREATWALSNVAAGTVLQVQVMIEEDTFKILTMLCMRDSFAVRREAVWALSNATSKMHPPTIAYLVECGIVPALVCVLRFTDMSVLSLALIGLENIMGTGEQLARQPQYSGMNPYLQVVEDAGGREALEDMQYSGVAAVAKQAEDIVVRFFSGERIDELMVPATAPDGSVYLFGLQSGGSASFQLPAK